MLSGIIRAARVMPAETSRGTSASVRPWSPANGRGHRIPANTPGVSVLMPHLPRRACRPALANTWAPMAARTTDHNVHMTVITTMRGSAFGMARAAASTAAMLRVPIPSAMTLR